MICQNCRHEIGPEDLKCPYCGADNPFAIQHEKNMRGFDKKYADTEKELTGFAKATEGLGKKAAVLIVLIIGIIVTSVISSINYADPDEDKAAMRDSKKNASAYAEEADGFLERGEYMEYVSFLYAHELMHFPPEEFERFSKVRYVAGDYYECMLELEEMILRSDDPDYFDGLDTDIEIFCNQLKDYLEVYEVQANSEKDEKYLGYMKDMDSELRAAMRVYFAMNEDELKEFMDMSQAKKAVRIREVLRNE